MKDAVRPMDTPIKSRYHFFVRALQVVAGLFLAFGCLLVVTNLPTLISEVKFNRQWSWIRTIQDCASVTIDQSKTVHRKGCKWKYTVAGRNFAHAAGDVDDFDFRENPQIIYILYKNDSPDETIRWRCGTPYAKASFGMWTGSISMGLGGIILLPLMLRKRRQRVIFASR